ncbi:MAG: SGNH/GDSL hydrolase family protein [Deltaproteobacteria bacterium]|nr:SGNH/GDSL hydrolase family protein [Deltaproteobacteria bacterium]
MALCKTNKNSFSLTLWAMFLCLNFCTASLSYACPDINGLVDVNCDKQLVILTFGDSITFGVGDELKIGGYPTRLRYHFPQAIVINAGRPGEQTPYGRTRAATIFASNPNADYIVILEGVNDWWIPNHSPTNTSSNLYAMVRNARSTGATSLLSTICATRRSDEASWVRSLNSVIRPYTQVDFYSLGTSIIGGDALHPNANGYDQMALKAAQSLIYYANVYRPADTDGDGLYNWKEQQMGSNPLIADTDGDGLNDGEEFIYNTNALIKDTDGDGQNDYKEIKVLGSDPLNSSFGAPKITSYRIIS